MTLNKIADDPNATLVQDQADCENAEAMGTKLLPPHLKVAETVTEEEYRRARWQRLVTLSTAMIVGVSVAFFGMIFATEARNWFALGIALALGLERGLNALLKDGHKMSTQRMRIYPELRDYLKRQQE